MQFLVLAEARDSIVGDAVPKLRKSVEIATKRVMASGKMLTGGILVGRRMAYMVIEAESPYEILELLGGEIIDNMNAQVQPIVSFEELGQFFAKHPWTP